MTTLNLDPDGSATVQIANGKGDIQDYALLSHEFGGERDNWLWQCELRRRGKTDSYTVLLFRSGAWNCGCPDFQFRGPQKRFEATCKHIDEMRHLYAYELKYHRPLTLDAKEPEMTTALAVTPQEVTAVIEYTQEKKDLIKKTIAVGATDIELQLFVAQCVRTGLDPFAKQIYCIKRKGKMVIQVGIDGLRLIADRTERYAGSDDPVFFGEGTVVVTDYEGNPIGEATHPIRASVTIWKIVAGNRCPFVGTVRWDEFYPGPGKDGIMWRDMPFNQLAKCAESQALRKAFPQDLSGVLIDSEAYQGEREDSRIEHVSNGQIEQKTGTNGAAQEPRDEAFQRSVYAEEEKAVANKVCRQGELVAFVIEEGGKLGKPADLTLWPPADGKRDKFVQRTIAKFYQERVAAAKQANDEPSHCEVIGTDRVASIRERADGMEMTEKELLHAIGLPDLGKVDYFTEAQAAKAERFLAAKEGVREKAPV